MLYAGRQAKLVNLRSTKPSVKAILSDDVGYTKGGNQVCGGLNPSRNGLSNGVPAVGALWPAIGKLNLTLQGADKGDEKQLLGDG